LPVSKKLALEIFTIELFHLSAILIFLSFSIYIYFRSKKSPVLFSYLAVGAMIMIWMVSKVLKTLSPNEGLRWFFIVTQYIGVDFLGYSVVVFAMTYRKDAFPKIKNMLIWAIPPLITFLLVLTNPLHMKFYSYYDFYKDRFGPLFYPAQIIQYGYLFTGIILLSKGYTDQPAFKGKKNWARLFACATLVPVFVNIYYILFKLSVFKWIFPFPVFDFTPIACTIALIFFMIPALRFRFFDISPMSYNRYFNEMPQGVVFMDRNGNLYNGNNTFCTMFNQNGSVMNINVFLNGVNLANDEHKQDFLRFVNEFKSSEGFEMNMNTSVYKVSKKFLKKGRLMLVFTDIKDAVRYRTQLLSQREELLVANSKLDKLAENTREIAITQTKSQIAQNMHDILGHSLTVVIGTTELAAAEEEVYEAQKKISRVGELLSNSLKDLQNTFISGETSWGQTSLTKAINHLKNESIEMDFVIYGNPYELSGSKTEAVFRMCQEAVTNSIRHGRAKNIHIILRYKPEEIEVFAIDDGRGCAEINKNYGLTGIEERIKAVCGEVNFGSDGESGFTIHAKIPKS